MTTTYYVPSYVFSDYSGTQKLYYNFTQEWLHSSMYLLMYHQITSLNKGLVTYFTGEWPLSSMYTLMYHQTILLNKGLVTNITRE